MIEWIVLLDIDFERWLDQQEVGLRREVVSKSQLLKQHGPSLGRPLVNTIKSSKISNLKELRIQYKGDPWRILFAFDPVRRAVLLVGGEKQGEKRWYEKNIQIAEERFKRHLEKMEEKR